MTEISRVLTANEAYAAARAHLGKPAPARRLAVITCMDARIDVFAALGLHLGEALVIRNAGGRVTDDVLRSLAVACHVLSVDTVVVMQHTNCGISRTTDDELRALTGADLDFATIGDHTTDLDADIDVLKSKPYLSQLEAIAGFVYDTETGSIEDVVRWRRDAEA